jgi:lipopolysaccharide export system permease protein
MGGGVAARHGFRTRLARQFTEARVNLIALPRAFTTTIFAWRFPSYLLREFVPLFLIFTPVLLVMTTIDFVANVAGVVITYKAPFALFLQSWFERFPYLLSYITPPSLAITILIGLGRLAKDSELKAAYAAGIPPLRLVWPVLFFTIPVTLAMFLNTNFLQPITDASYLDTIYKIQGRPGAPRTQYIKSYASLDGKTVFTAGSMTPKENDPNFADLTGVMIVVPGGTWTSTQGTWDARAKTWELNNVTYTQASLDQDDGSPLPSSPQVRRVFPFEGALSPDVRPPEHLALPELIVRANLETQTVLERYQANYRLQTRFADPFACIVFALVATSVGLTVANRGSAFAAVIVFIAGYFMIWTLGKGMAGSQAVPVWAAAWLPVMLFGTGSVLSLRRLT